MEEWLNTLKTAPETHPQGDPETVELPRGNHQWYTHSHARPTYCNVCRDTLHGKELYLLINNLILFITIIKVINKFVK